MGEDLVCVAAVQSIHKALMNCKGCKEASSPFYDRILYR